MDESLAAYEAGHQDGRARTRDAARAVDPKTGADYRVGLVDGELAAFEDELLAAVRRALGEAE